MNQEPDAIKSFALHSNPRCDQKWLKVDLQVILNDISFTECTTPTRTVRSNAILGLFYSSRVLVDTSWVSTSYSRARRVFKGRMCITVTVGVILVHDSEAQPRPFSVCLLAKRVGTACGRNW